MSSKLSGLWYSNWFYCNTYWTVFGMGNWIENSKLIYKYEECVIISFVDHGMRVGRDFQAVLPLFNSGEPNLC